MSLLEISLVALSIIGNFPIIRVKIGFILDYLGMNFWERVNDLLEKNDINKKTLAACAGFDASNITKGIKNNNIPSAETAVKIAEKLGVSVEYLVTGKDSVHNSANVGKGMYLYQKYQNVIDTLEHLSSSKQKNVMRIVEECGELGK